MDELNWLNAQTLNTRKFTCGHCGANVASQAGYPAQKRGFANVVAFVYVCHACTRPLFFDSDGKQHPGHAFGDRVADIPDKSVDDLYEEARRATAAGSFTGAVLCCRKLLMHVAVSKGAKPGEPFADYVQFLSDHNYVPPDARDWVDHIRKKGNEASHDIVIMSKVEAEELLSFCEMLLKVIFEFPAAVRRRTTSTQTN